MFGYFTSLVTDAPQDVGPDICGVRRTTGLTASSVTVVSRLSLILADFLVAIVTWWSTYKTSKLTRGLKSFEKNALSKVMLRDGENTNSS